MPIAALLLLINCGGAAVPPPTTPEYCGGRSCSGHNDCKVNVPVCGVMSTAYCLLNPPNECVWKIDTTNVNCRCIEHDIRLCTVPGTGAAGNQICTKTSSTSAEWSTCVPCPTCTPRP